MKAILLSSLVKVFKDTVPNNKDFDSFSCFKNEKFSFQIGLLAELGSETHFSLKLTSPIAENLHIYTVKNIPACKTGYDNSDSFHYDLKRTEFPDLLVPFKGKLTLKKGQWTALWVEYSPQNRLVGQQEIKLELNFGDKTAEKLFTLNILPQELPKQELLYTNWFHNDCLCTYYGMEPFSKKYWKIVEKYIENAAGHGMNMILTPVFTPPLDTEVGKERPTVQLVDVEKTADGYKFNFKNFRKYIRLCLEKGIDAFEISHLFTQWGAEHAPKIIANVDGEKKMIFGWETDATGKEYVEFLESFARAFDKEVKYLGIKKRCWIHVSDEPSEAHIETYKKNAELIHRIFKGYNNFDALSEIEYYRQGLVKTPVCGETEAEIFRAEVKNFWTYHCCGHVDRFVPNRMFSQPSARNRILGVLLYKYNAQGFLQWGHNFWYSQYSRYPIDPYKITDAVDAFPSGDAFVVYPDKNGKPLNSLRNLVFFDALQDLRALKLLESLTSREYVLSRIEQDLDIPLTFRTYPHESTWLLNLRKGINEEIAKLS